MIIVGAKGFAKELLEVCHQLGRTDFCLPLYSGLANQELLKIVEIINNHG